MTEVFAPAHLVIGLPPTVGAVASGWSGVAWGLLTAALCGGVPALVIIAGVRSGTFGDRHITDRAQRARLIAVTIPLVLLALCLLAVLGAPRLAVVTVAAMLVALAVIGPITVALKWKISFHAAVSAGSVVVLAHVLPPAAVTAAGALLVALIGWARVSLGDHTVSQVLAGTAVGTATTLITLTLAL
ncbi:phosphatase PAP2 family protein [Microtetraspora sp. NBRC 13810]|uniref:phosphatase PAP2 family protein n=1 Tax=Microtetraspora sp. NBRC 13810 TaxID=3030990 RepID=UPI00255459E5|nr:phosphatase PAP2 family protein [Microtetraspora sp. NBRC 13810]